MLFLMLDINSQKRIISRFYNNEDWEKIRIVKLLSFSGQLEIIRNMRNIINHYEPIIPFLINNMKDAKNIENTQIYYTIEFLKDVCISSIIKNINNEHINIDHNNFNSKLVRILNLIKELMK